MDVDGWGIKSEGVGHEDLEHKEWGCLRLEGLGNEIEKVVYGHFYPPRRNMGVREE